VHVGPTEFHSHQHNISTVSTLALELHPSTKSFSKEIKWAKREGNPLHLTQRLTKRGPLSSRLYEAWSESPRSYLPAQLFIRRKIRICDKFSHPLTLYFYGSTIVIVIIIIIVSCHRPFLPGTSFEPPVTPTAQVSNFTLQYFPYYV
jgi:hypothetical protein